MQKKTKLTPNVRPPRGPSSSHLSLWAQTHKVFYVNVIYDMYCSNTFFPHLTICFGDFSLSVYTELHHSLKISINELQFICPIRHQPAGGKVVSNFSPSRTTSRAPAYARVFLLLGHSLLGLNSSSGNAGSKSMYVLYFDTCGQTPLWKRFYQLTLSAHDTLCNLFHFGSGSPIRLNSLPQGRPPKCRRNLGGHMFLY